MSKPLQGRLGDAKGVFDHVHAALGRHPAGLPQEVETAFRALVDYHTDIDHWLGMIEARAAARQLLNGLETQADVDDCVPLGAARVKYQHVRLIGVQAYVTTNWALADRITGASRSRVWVAAGAHRLYGGRGLTEPQGDP